MSRVLIGRALCVGLIALGGCADVALDLDGTEADLEQHADSLLMVEPELTVAESAATVLHLDSFWGASSLSDYDVFDDETGVMGPSHWYWASEQGDEGVARQDSNIYTNDGVRPGTLLVRKDWSFEAMGDVQASIRATDNDAAGLVFRFVDAQHYYAFHLDQERRRARIVRRNGSDVRVLREVALPSTFTWANSHVVQVNLRGPQIHALLDGQEIAYAQDTLFTQGRIGMVSWGMTAVDFDFFAWFEREGLSPGYHLGPMRHQASGKCVAVKGGVIQTGATLELQDCIGYKAPQAFSNVNGELRAFYGSFCIDVKGGATDSKTPLQIWPCNGTGAQIWQHVNDTFVNPQSGKCFDLKTGQATVGQPIWLYDCNGTSAQRFSICTSTGSPCY